MRQETVSSSADKHSLSPFIAWRNALGIVVLLWLLLGVVNFGFVTDYLARTMSHDILLASFYLDLSFAIAAVIIVALIIFWQRAHGETLRDLGWRRPTTVIAIILAVIVGLLWVALSYIRVPHPIASFLTFSWERPIMMLIGLFLAFSEELAMRGFFMEQLQRGGVPTWLQVIASGVFMGGYHGIIGLHYSFLYGISSMVLFSIVALLYVIGKRSLTPGLIAHGMTHFLGDPTLTMGILHGAIMLMALH